ncbi:hypothetical protein BDB00DRAFT_523824 [Zychaea mexicana]|uniref:uncharacterized protein n=1 Tax=Zychaea mexicana TaxID=64656 RepID=UPI0022FE0122|nr:uncharacterized protein BDB00DRAFT_523824 [Zychaea mexicana]KAI9490862.1 hypothetical protein BDB00DRAFT_523824 [Zychaea mexicana]
MLLFLTIYNILRLVSSAILVSDAAAGNLMARQWFFEFAWPFGFGAFALYLIGIAQTLADSHKAISTGWLPSPLIVDIVGSSIFLAPIIINEPTSVITGYLSTYNVRAADILVRVHYSVWAVHCVALTTTVMYSGMRLVRILNTHLEKINPGGPRYDGIKTGIVKIRAVMLCIAICLSTFAAMMVLYSILRDKIMTSTVGNMALSGVWMLLGPVTTFFVECAVAFTPKSANIFKFGSKSTSSNEKSANIYETEYTSTFANNEVGTLSRNAFDDLKQQQLQHQQQQKQNIYDTHKSTAAVKILNGGDEIDLGRSYSTGNTRSNNIAEVSLVALAQEHHKQTKQQQYTKQQQIHSIQHSGSTSAQTSVTDEDIVRSHGYSSNISLIANGHP